MDFNKPRVSIWYYVVPQTNFRNDGPPLYLNVNLRRLLDGKDAVQNHSVMADDGGNVVHLQPNEPIHHHGTFDLNILVDHGEDGLSVPLDFEVPSPNAYWACDTHIDGHGFEYRLARARQFDHVFLCHKAQIPLFIERGIDPAKIFHLPLAAEPTCYRPHPIMEKYDWCFIGHMNSDHRMDMVDRFIKEFGLGGGKGYFGWRMAQWRGHCVLDDAAKKFSMARLVVSDSINNDINMRTWETLACRKLLITQRVDDIEHFFKDGVDLALYTTLDEAVEKARYYLAHDEERNRIAQAGYERFLAGHTYMHRAQALFDVCLPGWRSQVPEAGPEPEYDVSRSLVPESVVYSQPLREVQEIVQGGH